MRAPRDKIIQAFPQVLLKSGTEKLELGSKKRKFPLVLIDNYPVFVPVGFNSGRFNFEGAQQECYEPELELHAGD